MRCDLAIVGGGPVGCMTAAFLGPGYDVAILEEHRSAGDPVQCAGLVAPRVVELTGATSTVLNRIDSVHLHFPDGRDIYVKGNGTKALVMDRGRFDEH
ncbi:MAG TPA: FAD-dependent oxidoreductase, partial [Methanomassiliicoccales archaeon]|nr:FAD-dependent oxidoreductase [Methanomassiliicoccales archaeon]